MGRTLYKNEHSNSCCYLHAKKCPQSAEKELTQYMHHLLFSADQENNAPTNLLEKVNELVRQKKLKLKSASITENDAVVQETSLKVSCEKPKLEDVTCLDKKELRFSGINYENDGDYVNAAIAYLLAGEKGCLDSLFRASVIYEYGKGSVKANLESAEKHLYRAAVCGHTGARHNLALKTYKKDKLTKWDETFADFLLQQNVKEEVLPSMRSYSMRLLKKSTDPQKHKEAVDILKKASKLKCVTSTFNLAMCYLDGTGVDYIDRHKAYELLEKLAALDHKPSIRVLAGLLKADKLAAGIKRDVVICAARSKLTPYKATNSLLWLAAR